MPSTKPPAVSKASQRIFFAFDLGHVDGGIWTYHDQQQHALVALVKSTLNWDIQSFDAWLFGSACWNNYPRVRQRLIELRVNLYTALQEPGATPSKREADIKNYFRTVRRLGMRLDNLPDNLRQSMRAVVDCKADAASIKLDARSMARIQRLYQERIQSGRKYGAQTELAKQYGVSLATICKVLQTEKATYIASKLETK